MYCSLIYQETFIAYLFNKFYFCEDAGAFSVREA